MKITAGVQ